MNDAIANSFTEMSPVEYAKTVWWDMYKDAHGRRPRGVCTEGWTVERFDIELDYLQVLCQFNDKARMEEELIAATEFEALVASEMTKFGSRDEVIRMMMIRSESIGDPEYFCYKVGLPYGYFKQEFRQAA